MYVQTKNVFLSVTLAGIVLAFALYFKISTGLSQDLILAGVTAGIAASPCILASINGDRVAFLEKEKEIKKKEAAEVAYKKIVGIEV